MFHVIRHDCVESLFQDTDGLFSVSPFTKFGIDSHGEYGQGVFGYLASDLPNLLIANLDVCPVVIGMLCLIWDKSHANFFCHVSCLPEIHRIELKAEGRRRTGVAVDSLFCFKTWRGARVGSQRCPILHPGNYSIAFLGRRDAGCPHVRHAANANGLFEVLGDELRTVGADIQEQYLDRAARP